MSRSPALWACFLASSWTWCIGMFLPILLVRDLGWAGFFIFAIPNCLGAAAMGFFLRDATASTTFVNRHRTAIRLFSLITIAFHAAFLAWLYAAPATKLVTDPALHLAVCTVVAAVVALLPAIAQSITAALLWCGVLIATIAWLLNPAVNLAGPTFAITPAPALIPATTELPAWHALALAPVCLFGFALCPYLDATFHRARQSTSARGGRLAFALGFLLFFPLCISFTLLYAGVFLWYRPVNLELVTWHITLQAAFTVGVHANALANLRTAFGSAAPPAPRTTLVPAPPPLRFIATLRRSLAPILTTVGLFWLIALLLQHTLADRLALAPPSHFAPTLPPTLGLGETLYRIFMGAYGLLFPAYVFLIAIPRATPVPQLSTPSGTGAPPVLSTTRTTTRTIAAAAVTLAAPFFYLGFVDRQTLWLIPGLAIILLARLFIPRRTA